jgi:hypothetical protein
MPRHLRATETRTYCGLLRVDVVKTTKHWWLVSCASCRKVASLYERTDLEFEDWILAKHGLRRSIPDE